MKYGFSPVMSLLKTAQVGSAIKIQSKTKKNDKCMTLVKFKTTKSYLH